jgi:hypothetical protein
MDIEVTCIDNLRQLINKRPLNGDSYATFKTMR